MFLKVLVEMVFKYKHSSFSRRAVTILYGQVDDVVIRSTIGLVSSVGRAPALFRVQVLHWAHFFSCKFILMAMK